jgi:hypothetical protein
MTSAGSDKAVGVAERAEGVGAGQTPADLSSQVSVQTRQVLLDVAEDRQLDGVLVLELPRETVLASATSLTALLTGKDSSGRADWSISR